jgi:hypothetical protein
VSNKAVRSLDGDRIAKFACRDLFARFCLLTTALTAMLAAAQPSAPSQLLAGQAAAASWPHTIIKDGAKVTVYQPQAISWPERKILTARVALSILKPGQTTPLLGSIELRLDTAVDETAGVIHLANPDLLATHFPALDTKEAVALETKLRAALPDITLQPVPLASVLLSLKQLPVAAVVVNNDPPVIFYGDRAASLVVFDGEPVLIPAGTSGLSYAVNTNWDVFVGGGTWYLLNNGLWFSAPHANGPYASIAQLPAKFRALPKNKNFAEANLHIPATAPTPKTPIPKIFVSTKPAEIIVTTGAPSFRPVVGTGLQRVVNTAGFRRMGSMAHGSSRPINCRRISSWSRRKAPTVRFSRRCPVPSRRKRRC